MHAGATNGEGSSPQAQAHIFLQLHYLLAPKRVATWLVTCLTEVDKRGPLLVRTSKREAHCAQLILGTQLHSEQMLLVGERSRPCLVLSHLAQHLPHPQP